MCLIVIDWQPDTETPLLLISNRDEFYQRDSKRAHYWNDAAHIFGGRDLEKSGTWLAVSKTGKLAAVTNYREPNPPEKTLSRGAIPHAFLLGDQSAEEFAQSLKLSREDYPGFNALLFDGLSLIYVNNRSSQPVQAVTPGLYGLSNHLLDSPWPKVLVAKEAIASIRSQTQEQCSVEEKENRYLAVMQNQHTAEDEDLPVTGVHEDIERMLSPAFIVSPSYGTRTSSVVTINRVLGARFTERNYFPGGLEFEQQTHAIPFTLRSP